MYAVTETGYRSIVQGMQLQPGETISDVIPEHLSKSIDHIEAKNKRNSLLRDSDWTQMPDSPFSETQRLAWATYRQHLRDMTSLPGFPDVSWPIPPALDGAAGDIKAPI